LRNMWKILMFTSRQWYWVETKYSSVSV
jgi:hypothetical protein